MKKISFLTYFVVATLTISTSVFAQTVTDFAHFDTYKNGDLNRQDGWSDVWNSPLIQSETTFDGGKAIRNQKNFGTAVYKPLPEEFLDAGVVSAEIRIEGNALSDNHDIFGVFKGIGEEYIALFRFANNFDGYENMLLISVAGSTETKEIGNLMQNEWHKISLGWRKSDFNIRVKLDGNEWSEWFSSETSWMQREFFGVRISLPDAYHYGDFYLDNMIVSIGTEEIPVAPPEVALIVVPESITASLDPTDTSITTATLDDATTSTIQESITAPLTDTDTSTTTTTF